jgi:uncharacterized protein YjiS (DUF1127 family)
LAAEQSIEEEIAMLDYLTAAHTYSFSHTGRHRTLGRVLIAFASWRQRRRQCAELYALNDRMLKDICISRWEIEAIVNSPRPR